MIDDKQLEEWQALADGATEGPWDIDVCSLSSRNAGFTDLTAPGCVLVEDMVPEDAAFCAAARTAVPALIAEVRRLRAENARLLEDNAYLQGEG